MTVNLRSISFHDGGYCHQLTRLAGVRSWTISRFHALFVYFEHPEHGPSLIDTGYSRHIREATRPFPQRFYRWLLPVCLNSLRDPPRILLSAGCDPEIRRVFISHWHGDHIGGLNCFPKSDFVYRRRSYEQLTSLSSLKQVRQGFIRHLIPADFEARSRAVPETQFVAGSGELGDFRVLDYWGDGALRLVDLPGHAEGQTGFLLRGERQHFFYAADAYWHQDVFLAGASLPWISRLVQSDYAAYQITQTRLRRLATQTDWHFVACHCPKALKHVHESSC